MFKAFAVAPLDSKVFLFAYGNLLFSDITPALVKAESAMHFLLSAGQLAVAVATVYYIVKKARSLPKKRGRHPKT